VSTVNRQLVKPRGRGNRRSKTFVQNRRLKVWEAYNLGQTPVDIAKDQNCSERTIERDIHWWKQRLGMGASALKDPANAAMDVGMTAAKLQMIAEEAWVEAVASTNGSVKAKFLMVSKSALVDRHRLLADAEFLPKVGHDTDYTEKVTVTFEQRFGKGSAQAVFDSDKSRRKILEAGEALLRESMDSGMSVENLLEMAGEAADDLYDGEPDEDEGDVEGEVKGEDGGE